MADVLIAGAGPAGSVAALMLARAGLDVTIFERSAFPRTKICGEYLSSGTVTQLHDLGVAGELAPRARDIDGVRFFGPDVSIEIPFREKGWSVPRALLDEVLLNAAVRTGAKLVHARVEDVESGNRGVTFTVRDEDGETTIAEAPFAIAADGAQSVLAQKAGLRRRVRERRFALGGHFRDFSGLDRYVEMFVDGSSYFAVNPLADDRANVMLIVPERQLAERRDDVDAFVRGRAQSLTGDDRFGRSHLEGKRLATGPLAHRMRAFTKKRLLFAGDAAGTVDPFTGQGVCFALLSAQLAAVTIDEARKATTPGRDAWEPVRSLYESYIHADLAERQKVCRIIRALVRFPFLARRAAAVLRRDPSRADDLIDSVTGGYERPIVSLSTLVRLVV